MKSNQSDTEESKDSKEDSTDKKKLQVLKVKRTQQKSHFLIQFERQQMEMLNSFMILKINIFNLKTVA